MAKWILFVVIGSCIGCASQRVRVTVTRVGGQPSVSIELEEKGIRNESRK